MPSWRPSATIEALHYRAAVNSKIRHFFAARNVLEVETPVLSQAAVSDPYLIPLTTSLNIPGCSSQTYYLHTSPEYPMKRLLAAGSGSIYQLCKVFRNDEVGRLHNPEFSLLEWYRIDFDEHQLMDEIQALFEELTPHKNIAPFERLTYREVFSRYLTIDPHTANLEQLNQLVGQYVDSELLLNDRDGCLDVLISHVIEPQLKSPTFIYDYPRSMAALAQTHVDATGTEVARRFELYAEGVELANGYFELQNADEQRKRFLDDQLKRKQLGVDALPIDEHLIDALNDGMPSCAGVALGVDRLLMVLLKTQRIDDVLSFTVARS